MPVKLIISPIPDTIGHGIYGVELPGGVKVDPSDK